MTATELPAVVNLHLLLARTKGRPLTMREYRYREALVAQAIADRRSSSAR